MYWTLWQGAIHQRRPVERGGCRAKVDHLGRGGSAINRTSRKKLARKNISFGQIYFGVSVVRIGVQHQFLLGRLWWMTLNPNLTRTLILTLDSQNVILHHNDVIPHTAHATVAAIEAKGWAILPHPLQFRPCSIWFSSIWNIEGLPERTEVWGWRGHQASCSLRLWTGECDPDFFKNGFISWKTI